LSAREISHKQTGEEGFKPSDLPFIHPGQLTVFDLLGDGEACDLAARSKSYFLQVAATSSKKTGWRM
jgi:hypothetical protein